MFCVNVEPWFYSDTPVWFPFPWNRRMLQVEAWVQFGTLMKEQGAMTWASDCGEQRTCQEGLRAAGPKGCQPIYYNILLSE